MPKFNLNHILNHLGEDRATYFNAVAPPIVQSSNFAFPDLHSFREAFIDESVSYAYTRGNNPTVAILRKKLAALEHTEDALVFSSGAAAVSAAILTNVQAGDHIVCVRAPYSWTYKLVAQFLPRFGVTHTFIDGTDMKSIENAIQSNTKLIYLESPNSLTFDLQDLSACAALAKKHNLITVIDNSYCSPIFQNPVDFGIDIVVHSGTKYLNGHSDVVFGAVCAATQVIKKMFDAEYMTLGAIISPHDAASILKGLRTLPLRMKRSDETAKKVIAWLAKHPKVEKIYYPFSLDNPQYDLAKRQMRGCGGLFSVQIKLKDIQAAEDFFHRLRHFLLAVSWGGHESLVLPTCAFYNIRGKRNSPMPWNLFRFYIGLEDAKWLIADLKQALDGIES